MNSVRLLIIAAIILCLPGIAHARQWGVHLASYKMEANARNGWAELTQATPGLLAGLVPYYSVVDIPGKGRFIRLIAGPLPSQQAADALRREFERHGVYAAARVLPALRTPPHLQTASLAPAQARPIARKPAAAPPAPAKYVPTKYTPAKSPTPKKQLARQVRPAIDPLPFAGENLQVRIRPVSRTDLAGMQANPVCVSSPEQSCPVTSEELAAMARPRSSGSGLSSGAYGAYDDAYPQPAASISLHSDTLAKNSRDNSELGPGGEDTSPEFAGVAIGTNRVTITPGVCRQGDDLGPYAGIGVSF
ncbi:SPOR domain-containing protein [Oceanidesulfovibrio marinus]|uniref:SPOR domain-containing protein n=1 Tax=Oceanidesulfovibrio marinus TaxID=370038 RepID=A0A6P1ZF04_9BACT|nr:SPOR domain-containing protein [Oceanidesulfovibrio marinus]TVM32522.1 hypothetical protein DQK91_14705 [Oceanidesulfovibrio marinus]